MSPDNQSTNQIANVLHHVPGRMRVRMAFAKDDRQQLEKIQRSLSPLPGVRQVTVNPTLGTIIVVYDPSLFAEFPRRLSEHAAQEGLFTLHGAFKSSLNPEVSLTDASVQRFLENVNRRVQSATADLINLKELFPFGVLLYALTFVDRATSAAQWLNWVQFAFSSYMELHQDEPVAEVAHSVEALRADVTALHGESIEKMRAEFEALRTEIRALVTKLQR